MKMYYSILLSDSSCIQLRMEIETDSVLSEEHVKAAIEFGLDPSDVADTKKYLIGFIKRLLLHREKVEKNLLEAKLNPVIAKLYGGDKPEGSKRPEQKYRLYAILSNRPIITATTR